LRQNQREATTAKTVQRKAPRRLFHQQEMSDKSFSSCRFSAALDTEKWIEGIANRNGEERQLEGIPPADEPHQKEKPY
jgi:hypothetical protein